MIYNDRTLFSQETEPEHHYHYVVLLSIAVDVDEASSKDSNYFIE